MARLCPIWPRFTTSDCPHPLLVHEGEAHTSYFCPECSRTYTYGLHSDEPGIDYDSHQYVYDWGDVVHPVDTEE